jgi:hypothetical protein
VRFEPVQQPVETEAEVGVVGAVDDAAGGVAQRGAPGARGLVGVEARLVEDPQALLGLAPDRCGSYPLEGRFTSHNDETATSRAPVDVTGCDTEPQIAGLRARRRAGRIELAWTLSSPGGRTEIALDRRVSVRPWVRWRRVRALVAAARVGANQTRLAARGGRRMRPGRYRVTLTTFGTHGRPADTRRAEVTVR